MALLALASACATTPPARTSPDPAIWQGYCRALWQDELGRDIGDGLADCTTQLAAGRTVEAERVIIRASDEYAARQAAIDAATHPKLQPLHVEGRRFVKADGSVFIWRGITAFRLLHMLVNGDEAGADAYLAWCADHGVSIVRVLSSAWNLFRLDATAARGVLPRLLEMAEAHGVYVEVVALADTKPYPFNFEEHVAGIGAICAVHPACLVEIGNEIDPLHDTQDARLGDVAYVTHLRSLMPSSVLVALGSSHSAAADGSTKFAGGDYVTVHEDRADGDNGWRWVRHRNDTRDLAEKIGKPLVGDEPKRDDLSQDKHFAFAVLARINGLGDTFHYGGGLGTTIPTGAELDAFEARRRGWDAIPEDFTGHYENAGLSGSPVLQVDWSTALKVFSSINAETGYTVALDAHAPDIDWSDDWPTREVTAVIGGTWLWELHR